MDYLLNFKKSIHPLLATDVLNLIINGLPSKQRMKLFQIRVVHICFKPYYKWITF